MWNGTSLEHAAPTPDFLAAPILNLHHPSEVLAHPDLNADERRAILAGWASDVHAVEDAPWLRQLENGARISIDEILLALSRLDDEPASAALRRPGGFATIRQSAARIVRPSRGRADDSPKISRRPQAADLRRVNSERLGRG
jgi:hypothetical protein